MAAAIGAVFLSVAATAGAATYTGTVGADGKVTITMGDDTIVINGIGASYVSGVYPEGHPLAGQEYQGLKSPDAGDIGRLSNAIGNRAQATGMSSNAIGDNAQATGSESNAIGHRAQATGADPNAIGKYAQATGITSNAIGYQAQATDWYSNAIGGYAQAKGWHSNALGFEAHGFGNRSNAIGNQAQATGADSNAIGNQARATGSDSNAIGNQAQATGMWSAAIGYKAKATASAALALGDQAIADEYGTISIGRSATEATATEGALPEIRRRIVHVAEGTNGTDAATVSQTSTLDSSSRFLSINGDSTNTNGSKKYLLDLKLSDSIDSETEGLVTNKTVKAALEGLGFESGNDLTNYAKADASNISANAAAWATALGTGTIASGSNLLITGAKIYDELHLSEDGNYVLMSQTTGQNILALDTQLKALADSIGAGSGPLPSTGDRKHASVVSSDGTIHVDDTGTNEAGGKQYDLSISETADFTAKQTTWKDGTSISTANSSGFFSGGASTENADAYVSKGVVSAGKDEATRIVLDGNTGKATFGKTVTIDGATGRISGVAAGEVSADSTDAVNGAQLYAAQQGIAQNAQGLENLGRQVNKMDRKIDRTGALAAALAALHPQAYDENHPVTGAVGIGHYKGKQALAVGMFVRPVENFMVSLGASAGSDDYMLNAGASFRFGGASLQKSPIQMASKISEQEVTIRDLSAQNQVQKTLLESQKGRLDAQKVQLDAQASEIEKLKAMMAEIQAKLAK